MTEPYETAISIAFARLLAMATEADMHDARKQVFKALYERTGCRHCAGGDDPVPIEPGAPAAHHDLGLYFERCERRR